jgi:hypothetical protein
MRYQIPKNGKGLLFALFLLGLWTGTPTQASSLSNLLTEQDTVKQDTIWRKGANVAFLLQQVGLRNWAGGGESSLSYGTEVALFTNKKKDNHIWNNSLGAGYGLIQNGGRGVRKNNDYLILISNYGRSISKSWKLSAILDFRTQFAPGYRYEIDGNTNLENEILISEFLAPGYLQPSVGLTYVKDEVLSATISPITNRITIVRNRALSDEGAFGVDPGKTVRSQLGASMTASLKKEIMENVQLRSNLQLFGDYQTLRNIDVLWDLFIVFKVNKYISTNFTLQMIYDDDIKITRDDGTEGPALQMRNILNIGINFKL